MTTETITPVAIDGYVPVDEIDIVDRHRRDLGDLNALADSIRDVGLLHPITLTRTNRLVAGQRRLEAVRLVGMDTVPVRYVDTLDDAAALLRAERDENVCRKDMAASELYAMGKALEALERPKAAERQREAGLANLHPESASTDANSRSHRRPTAEAVGTGLGMSAPQWSRLKHIGQRADGGDAAAAETLANIDAGRQTVHGGYDGLRAPAAPKHQPKPEPKPAVSIADPDWIPDRDDRNPGAAERRREVIREMAPRGYSSHQIGDRLGILPGTIRRLARENGITIPADQVMAKTRQTIDSNRVVREIVTGLEVLDASIKLIDFDELDVSELGYWTDSLSNSIRMLNRLNKQLKEKAQ